MAPGRKLKPFLCFFLGGGGCAYHEVLLYDRWTILNKMAISKFRLNAFGKRGWGGICPLIAFDDS